MRAVHSALTLQWGRAGQSGAGKQGRSWILDLRCSIDGLVGRCGCKDFSRANPDRQKLQGVVMELTSPGKNNRRHHEPTPYPLDGLLAHDWLLLENVDAIDDNDPTDCSPFDTPLHRIVQKGYDTQACHLTAANYGVPLSCSRLFLLALRRPARRCKIADCDGLFPAIITML